MDNPQHYQPLSHALNLPLAGPSQSKQTYTSYSKSAAASGRDEDEDEGDEGAVEEQLNRSDPDAQASNPSSPNPKADSAGDNKPAQDSPADAEPKRRPGRPRGSKNRRPRSSISQTPAKPSLQYTGHTTLTAATPASTPPQHPDINAQNQQYYEFQWRVLNLCAEFYGAAEELVKGTQPLVIAQCYQMGPGSKVDPLVMLNEAKRICDTLLANPSQLISSPPPPMLPGVPSLYQGPPPVSQPLMPPPPAPGTKTTPPAAVITQPQSFVIPMGTHQYPVYAPPPGAYPASPFYQYSYAPPGPYFTAAPAPQPHATAPQQQPPSTTSQDESSSRPAKETSSRGVKRRREAEEPDSPARPNSATAVAPNSTSSPHSQPATTPIASPSLQNQQRPSTSVTPAPPTSAAPSLPWPMPTVAANTPSPVIASASTQDQRVTSYYRPRPADSSKPPVGHTYINYQPNGTTSRLTQNGK